MRNEECAIIASGSGMACQHAADTASDAGDEGGECTSPRTGKGSLENDA